MRYLRYMAAIMLCALALGFGPVTAHAAAEDKLTELDSAVPEEARELLGGAKASTSLDIGDTLNAMLERLIENMSEPVTSAVKNGVAVLTVSALCAVAGVFADGASVRYVRIAGILSAALISLTGVRSLVGAAFEAMDELYIFSGALLPTLAAAAAASGSITGGAVKLAASTLFLDVLVTAANKLIMPMIYAYVAASAASCAFGGAVKSAVKLIKWCVNTMLTVLVTVFTAYISVTGLIASTADAAAVRVTKTAISTLLPVVGKLVADASDSITSGFAVVKNAAGAFGILVIIAVTAGPFVRLAANYLVFKAAAALAEPFAGEGLADFISDIGTALGFAMAAVGACAAVLYISVVATLKAVGT